VPDATSDDKLLSLQKLCVVKTCLGSSTTEAHVENQEVFRLFRLFASRNYTLQTPCRGSGSACFCLRSAV